MKKLLLILTTILLISCDDRPNSKMNFTEAETYGCALMEFTVRGKTHEYILYMNGNLSGMEHLPECKYCKEQL